MLEASQHEHAAHYVNTKNLNKLTRYSKILIFKRGIGIESGKYANKFEIKNVWKQVRDQKVWKQVKDEAQGIIIIRRTKLILGHLLSLF